MRHLKLYEDLFRKDYSGSQIIKAVKIIKDHAESIGNDPEGKEAYIFRVDGKMVFLKSLAKGVSIETLEAELPEMEKWGKEIVEQIESETSILDIDYRTFIDRREDFLGIGIRFFFPFDISDDVAVAVEESLSYPNIEYRDISNEELDGFTPEELNRILVCNNDGQGDTHCYTFSDMVNIISESEDPTHGCFGFSGKVIAFEDNTIVWEVAGTDTGIGAGSNLKFRCLPIQLQSSTNIA